LTERNGQRTFSKCI